MTVLSRSSSRPTVPGRIEAPLRQIARRQWVVLSAVGALRALTAGLAALLVAALLLGSFQGMWMPARVALAAVAWAIVIGSPLVFLRPALRRWSLSRSAMQVERQHPHLQERLSSAVELAGEANPTFRGSPALLEHLMRQAEADAAAVRPDQVVRNDPIVRWSLCLVPVLLAWLVVALVPATTRTAMAGLYRVLMPWRAALPAVLTRVAVQPGDVVLTQGDAIDISARVAIDSGPDRTAARATLVRQFENGQKLTEEMDRVGPREFRAHFDDLRQSFAYQVLTDQGDSPTFRAVVHPRPTIAALDLRYEYPRYTGLPPSTEPSRDGNIDALAGTRVTLTIHTALPVVLEKSRVLLDPGQPEEITIPLRQPQPGKPDYQATLIVSHSGHYRIDLTNEFDLTNRDEQPRTIVARPDEVPTIVIESPDAQLTVRPDDVVPVRYTATDDFGVSKIEAVLQFDDHDAFTVPVKFKADDPRNITGPAYRIDLAALLAGQKLDAADHLTYQLKVTDNRDPDPQFSFSARQTLKINKYEPQSYATKLDQKVADDLRQAIRKAIEDLDRNRPRVEGVKNADPKRAIEEYWKHELDKVTNELPQITKALDKAADQATNTPFHDIARTVRQIADNPIRAAAEDAARADLNVDAGADRQEAATRSAAEMTEAREALQKLLERQAIEKRERASEAARDLAEAARKQQEAADLMKSREALERDAQARQDQERAMQRQAEARAKLQQAIEKAEPLRDAKAQQLAQQLQQLIQNVEQQEKQQQANAEQAEKHEAANAVQQDANGIAKQQEALNQDIRKTADERKQPIEQAGANAPAKDQQDNIVRQLNRNELAQAREAMRNAANQLRDEAHKLQDLAKNTDLKPDDKQRAALTRDQQAADQARDEQTQANQSADALKQSADQNAVPKPDDAAVQHAHDLAQAIEKQADALAQQAADAEKGAREAAQAAEQSNDQPAAKAAQQAEHDAQAAGKAAASAHADAQAADDAAQQAAKAANPADAQKDLRQASDELRKAGQELAQAADQDQNADKNQMAARQMDAAHQAAAQATDEARRQDALARALEDRDKQLAQAKQNQQPLDQAAQQEGQLAEQTKAAEHQADELRQLAQADQDANVAHRAEQARADLQQAERHEAAAATAEQQARAAEEQAGNAPDAAQAAGAEQKAAEALRQADEEQHGAQQALARAERELRDLPEQVARADADHPERAPHNGQHDESASHAGQPHGAEAHEGGNENGQEHGAGDKVGSPEQEQQQAAQSAQEASQAQQEAGQQNPAAAQEAARALNDAARAMADAVPGSLHQGDEEQGQDADHEPGHEPGQHEGLAEDTSTTPGQTPDSKQGISIAADAARGIPAAVRDIGITPDQWAKLPPMARKDLLNAAQQSGPPAYRQMIKDYYVRVAKLQNGRAAAR